MSDARKRIRKIVARRGVQDPAGLKEAFRTGRIKDFLLKECVAAGLDDASIQEAFNVEFLAEMSRDLTDKQDIIDNIENALDIYVFEPMYQREFGDHLDSKLQEKFNSLGINISKTQLVEEALKVPKVTLGVMSCVASVWALSILSHGISIKAALHAGLTHDLWWMSYNCYRKTYILKAVRLMHVQNGIAGTIFNAVSSAITGRESENTKYLREINTDVVFHGTFFDNFRRWFYQMNPDAGSRGKNKAD